MYRQKPQSASGRLVQHTHTHAQARTHTQTWLGPLLRLPGRHCYFQLPPRSALGGGGSSQPEARSPGFLGRQRPWAIKKKAFLGVRSTPTAWGTLGGIPKRGAPRRGLTQRSKAEPGPDVGVQGGGGRRSRTRKGAGLGGWAGGELKNSEMEEVAASGSGGVVTKHGDWGRGRGQGP